MSVVVKSMKMPESCRECRFSIDYWCYAKSAHGVPTFMDHRPDWCTLVELPVGHGRLVDAESLDMERLYRFSSSGDGSLELVYTKEEYPTVVEVEDER